MAAIPAVLCAGDFSGRWAGAISGADGAVRPVYLELGQPPQLAGTVRIGDGSALAIDGVSAQGDELHFRAGLNAGQPADFALTFVVSGNPLSIGTFRSPAPSVRQTAYRL